jgi:hypothetical protein
VQDAAAGGIFGQYVSGRSAALFAKWIVWIGMDAGGDWEATLDGMV